MGYTLLGTELSPKKYQAMYDLFSKDLPKGISEFLQPNQVLINFDGARKLLDITVLTFWTNNFRRYDWRTKQLLFADDEDDVGSMERPGSPGFYGDIMGQHTHLNQPYADSQMSKRRLEETLSSIFGDRIS